MGLVSPTQVGPSPRTGVLLQSRGLGRNLETPILKRGSLRETAPEPLLCSPHPPKKLKSDSHEGLGALRSRLPTAGNAAELTERCWNAVVWVFPLKARFEEVGGASEWGRGQQSSPGGPPAKWDDRCQSSDWATEMFLGEGGRETKLSQQPVYA